ncbi:uncharacterized protein C05D11.1-like [Lineus longissimus]|uniref:uncharacterized protein C05D11.1-like n=1 Tax=Lineus longissimus TaxID=88925 RepID=UPI002B4E036C
MAASDDYEILSTIKVNGSNGIPVTKYRSKRSGLTLCIAEVDGPIVNGYFCLATEAHDDDGLPHTLEHLVFMGSEDYPYKGVLDLLANRCLASGTNAWTDTDHTCYTMTNAGSEGFLKLMPIYLDHVLYPTITESGYITEVHHVNGEGDDAGVVYCEMQARENSGESRTYLSMLRSLYPGHCGYKSETGGMLEELRTSTSHEKVCNYHKEFYRPENLCLVITGQVKAEDVFEALKTFEDKIEKKGERSPHVRPWQSSVPPLESSEEKYVHYPSDDEDHGIVITAWRGPMAKDQFKMTALMVLMEYLTDTAIAPLQRDFVELDEPFCSKVRYSIIENNEACVYIYFENVPKPKLGQIKERLLALLKNIVDKKEEIDMKRMGNVIQRRVLESYDHLETQPHDTFAFICIGDFLYGDSKEDFSERFSQIESFRKLRKNAAEYWVDMVKEFFVGKPYVSIIGNPSQQLMEEMGKVEKERVAKQQEELGQNGLKELEEKLKKATEENELEPPEDVITSVDVPSVSCIKFHPLKPSSNHVKATANANKLFPLAAVPVAFQLDDIRTNFIQMTVLFNCKTIPQELRLYLPLYLEVILESPIMRNGELVNHEDVIAELAADTLSIQSGVGIFGHRFSCGDFAQSANLNIKVEREKYEKGVQWLHDLMYEVKFKEERVRIIATKMSNDVSRLKRNGGMVVKTMLGGLNYDKKSNQWATNMMRQQKFLMKTLENLEKDPQEILDCLKRLGETLTKPSNFIVHMAADVEKLSMDTTPQSPWKYFLPKGLETPSGDTEISIVPSYELYNEMSNLHGLICGVGSVESSYLTQSVPCVQSFEDPDLPAIMVYIQYLTQLEGPMWRQIRGLGLSYHYSISVQPETGQLYFVLYKSSQLVAAYKQAKEIFDGYLSHRTPFTDVELETSKSSLIFEIIERETSVSDASVQSMLSYFRGVHKNYNRELLQKVSAVTLDDLETVGARYFLTLFDPYKANVAVCCHPNKVTEIKEGFKTEFGRDLKVLESLDEGFLVEM